MKKIFFLFTITLFINKITAQQLTGRWYSDNSSRVYEIKQANGYTFEAIIQSSARKDDKQGYRVIKNLTYNIHKKRYEGVIYSVTDNKPAFVKIKFDKSNSNKIILKLERMFVMNVAINWVRAES